MPKDLDVIKKTIEPIVESLCADNHAMAINGLADLDEFLKGFVPSVRLFHESGTVDARLSALRSLQDNFQYNLSAALLLALETFLHCGRSIQEEHITLACRHLSGLVLIHSDSKKLFNRRQYMVLVLSYLNPQNPFYSTTLCISFLSVLIHILLKNTKNMRMFEANNGCQIIIRHLNLIPSDYASIAPNQQNLYFKVIEFLIFYLADESESCLQEGVSSLTLQEKADLFRPEFPAINDLIENLNDLKSIQTVQ